MSYTHDGRNDDPCTYESNEVDVSDSVTRITVSIQVTVPSEELSSGSRADLSWNYSPSDTSLDPQFSHYCSRCVVKSSMFRFPCACVSLLANHARQNPKFPPHLKDPTGN